MNEIQIDREEYLKEYKAWLEKDKDIASKEVNYNQIGANSTAPINTMYGKIQVENYKLKTEIVDKKVLGRPNTKHGEVAEHLEIRNRNKQHILNSENPNAHKADRFDQKADIIDGEKKYQMKFNQTADGFLKEITSPNHDYRNTEILVPKDKYEEYMKALDKSIEGYKKAIAKYEALGDENKVRDKKERLSKAQDARKNAKPAMGNLNPALDAAQHGKLAVAKYVVKDSVESGLKAGAVAAVVSGTVAGITNTIKVINGEITTDKAIADTVKTAGKAAIVATGYGMATSSIQGAAGALAHKATEGTVKNVLTNVAGNNAVTYVLVGTVEFTKVMKKYYSGEIDKKDMLISLGNTAVGMTGSIIGGKIGGAIGATVGTLVIPVPGIGTLTGEVVGEIIGATIGYMVTTAFYHSVIEVMHLKSLAKEYEKMIPLLKEAREEARKAREEFERVCREYRMARFDKVSSAMRMMDSSIERNNIDEFLTGLNTIMSFYGESILYTDFDKFDRDMLDDDFVITI